MCFSAEASFAVAGVLTVVGWYTNKCVKTKQQKPFALIPWLFAIQQAAEGFVWLSAKGHIALCWGLYASYIFLLFALAIWPVWIPFSLLALERGHSKRTRLSFLGGWGVAVGIAIMVNATRVAI